MSQLPARLLLDLRCVEQRGNDCRRTNADGDTGLHQLVAAFFTGFVVFIVAVAHGAISMAFDAEFGSRMSARFTLLPNWKGTRR